MTDECGEYVKEKMKLYPRFLQPICQIWPEAAKKFADFYEEIFKDGALDRKTKELIFTAIGVATASPRCIVHVIAAVEAGATDEEILEAVTVGFIGAGFYPNNPGIPYAFEYAAKALEVAQKYRKGEDWEYLQPPEFRG